MHIEEEIKLLMHCRKSDTIDKLFEEYISLTGLPNKWSIYKKIMYTGYINNNLLENKNYSVFQKSNYIEVHLTKIYELSKGKISREIKRSLSQIAMSYSWTERLSVKI